MAIDSTVPDLRLPPEEAAPLWRQFQQTRDTRLRTRLIEGFLFLVRATLARTVPLIPARVEDDDLYEAGVFALIKCVDSFDLAYGPRFACYAIPRIRGAFLDYLRFDDEAPRGVRTRANRVGRASRLLESQGINPTMEAVADALDQTVDWVEEVLKEADRFVSISLDDLIETYDEDGVAFHMPMVEAFAASEGVPLEHLLEQETHQEMQQMLSQIPAGEREVLSLCYLQNQTLKEVARELAVSERKIRALHEQGLERMRALLAARGATE